MHLEKNKEIMLFSLYEFQLLQLVNSSKFTPVKSLIYADIHVNGSLIMTQIIANCGKLL